jgi:uncharacterized protein YdeI (YjbR/CyaY-like superfamily)
VTPTATSSQAYAARMAAGENPASVPFRDASEWEAWLEGQHGRPEGVWIKMAKKGAGIESVRYPEVLEVALCFGWIDAQRKPLDEHYFLQRFTPRRRASRWSRINRDTAQRLITQGRMRPAGLAEVESARADGRWEAAYESQRRSAVPDDLAAELEARPRAKANFAVLSAQNRYAILYRLGEAKRPQTRARRLAQFVAMLEAGETIHP